MIYIQKLYKTCMDLKAISGTNDKKAFLKQYEHDIDFKLLLKFLLNPRVITGIDEAKINKKIKPMRAPLIMDFENLFTYLEQNNTGRDSDITVCQMFIERQEPELRGFVSSVITKSLKLGVDVKTVNAVYGNDFIIQHEVQQGSPRDKLRLKAGEVFYLTQKLNGVRGTYQNGTLISRQGIPFTGLEHILKELDTVETLYGNQVVFDGELIRKNMNGLSDNDNFKCGTGIINSDDGDKTCIEFVIFDMLPADEFMIGKSTAIYKERRFILDQTFAKYNFQHVRVVPVLYSGSDIRKIDELLEDADRRGWEGLMLNKDVPYYCKRHTGLVKIKTFKFSDLKIVGYEEGSGKYTGMLGAIIVEYKGNTINVGSGFTDEQRTEYWENRDWLVGKIAEIKYKDESSDKKTGAKSLQFPIFCRLRFEKTEPSLES